MKQNKRKRSMTSSYYMNSKDFKNLPDAYFTEHSRSNSESMVSSLFKSWSQNTVTLFEEGKSHFLPKMSMALSPALQSNQQEGKVKYYSKHRARRGGTGSLKPGKMDSSVIQDKGTVHQEGKGGLLNSQHTLDCVIVHLLHSPSSNGPLYIISSEGQRKGNV